MNNEINILIVSRYYEDQERIAAVLSNYSDFNIIGVENDEAGALTKTERLKPDIVILDLITKEISGPDMVRVIRRKSPSTSVIIINDKDDNAHESYIIKTEIAGYLLKEIDMDKLALAVKLISLGGCYINDSITERILNKWAYINQFPGLLARPDLSFYSQAERAIVTLLAQGYSDEQISKELHYRVGSIRNSIIELRIKTNIQSRVGIVVYSLISGLIRIENLELWKKKINDIARDNEGKQARTSPRVARKMKKW